MIDICAFFEYTTNVSRGKMVTIYRKNLLASCLFLLGYSSFFLLAVSGSYDYTKSGVFASELEQSKPEKHRNEWLSNHEWDYSPLKGNYYSRRKSRSTLENETSRVEGVRTEETSRGAEGEWMPGKERTVERFVGPESIGNASGFVQEEKEKEDSDAIKNTTVTIESDINLEKETKKEIFDDEKSENKDHLKDEISVKEGKEEKNATETLQFRSMLPWFSTELGQESPDDEPENGEYPRDRWTTSVKIPSKEFLKEILRRKDHRHRKGGKKGGESDIEFENSKDYDENFEERKEEEGEDVEDEKEESDLEESREKGQAATDVSSSTTRLFKMMSDMFLPRTNNDIGNYPWRALTSSKYTKQVTKQEGPHLKQTTKETKSKVSFFFADNHGQTLEVKNNSTELPNIDNPEISQTDQRVEDTLSARSESIKDTTSEPIEMTTKEQIEITTIKPMIVPERKEYETTTENVERSWVFNEKDSHDVKIYNILDTNALFLTRILDLRDQPILYWY